MTSANFAQLLKMNEFQSFIQLGYRHIIDPQAYDHLLFIVTLCAVYRWQDWRRLLVLVTAFTIGHSLTLALTALDIIRVPSELVELLIPITILLTALHNIWSKSRPATGKAISVNYGLALGFGLIHGMGFANYFRILFGEMGNIVKPLFAFNLGLELGQLLIVLVFLGLYFLLSQMFVVKQREWNIFVSGAGFGVSTILILEQLISLIN